MHGKLDTKEGRTWLRSGSRGQGVDEPVNSPAVMRGSPILPGHQ